MGAVGARHFVRQVVIRIRNGNTEKHGWDTEDHGSGGEGNQIPLYPPFSKGETGSEFRGVGTPVALWFWRGWSQGLSLGAGASSPWGVALIGRDVFFLPLGLGGGGRRGRRHGTSADAAVSLGRARWGGYGYSF